MAGREFTVKARITADTKDAERNTRALAKAEKELADSLTVLKAKFDAGEISATKFAAGQARLERQAERTTRQLTGGGAALTSSAAGFDKLSASVGGLVTGLGGLVALNQVAQLFVGAAKAAAEQESADVRLSTALLSLGANAKAVTEALKAQASALQSTTGFADEQIQNAQARIAANVKEQSQIEALTKATIDFASAKGLDLVRAAELVSKTVGSSSNSLTRYGIAVEGAAGSTERVSSALQGLAKFSGTAEAQMLTLEGQVKKLSNSWGELAERIGAVATSGVAKGVLKDITTALDEVTAAADRNKVSTEAMVSGAVRAIPTLGPLLDLLRQRWSGLSEAQDAQRESLEKTIATNRAAAADDEAKAAALEKETKFTEALVLELEKMAGATVKANSEKRAAKVVTDEVAESTLVWSRSLGIWIDQANVVNTEVGRMISHYKGVREQVLLTAAAFDELAAAEGRAAAVTAAVNSGGSLSSDERRVQISGGSRLTNEPGLTGITSRNTLGVAHIKRKKRG